MSPISFDRRMTPARADLAAARLRGLIEAPRYAEGARLMVIQASAPLRRAPDGGAVFETEALFGETVTLYDEAGGWAWVELERDGYVGYLPRGALGPPGQSTHRVAALRTHAYPAPDIKRPPLMALSLGALVAIARRVGDFVAADDGFYLWAGHVAPLEAYESDFVAVAERFLETPYLWGGRTSEGIDCSGLVQTALAATGVKAPRDSDMMEAALGGPLPPGAGLRRGDLAFWKGHVGILRDSETLLHANGWRMKVASEPLADACARTAAGGGGEITSIHRL